MAIETSLFPAPSVPMSQPLDVMVYNKEYLSIIFNLQKKDDDRRKIQQIYFDGEQTTYMSDQSEALGHWFTPGLEKFVMYERRPWFVVNGDTDLMARLKVTGEDLQAIQGKEIAVYFFEPLFQRSKSEHNKRCPAFYDEHSDDIYFPELLWLEDFNRNHGGQLKIVAYVCDYSLGDFLRRKNLHPQIRVETMDLFLLQTLHWKEMVSRNHRDPDFKISKKFICPNFRYEGYREIVVSFLEGLGHTSEGHVSFFYEHQAVALRKNLPFDPTGLKHWDIVQQGITQLQTKLPLTFDTEKSRIVPHGDSLLPDWDKNSNLRKDDHMEQPTMDSYLSIVNESRYGVRCGEISEKICHPILARRPFVVVGAPYTLRYLREMGFRTFSDFWDESYDEIEDHGQRMDAILTLLKKILKPTLPELQARLLKMTGRLDSNYLLLTRDLRAQMHKSIWVESERGSR